jgi:hypothetical protein
MTVGAVSGCSDRNRIRVRTVRGISTGGRRIVSSIAD